MAVNHWFFVCDTGGRGTASSLGDPSGYGHPTCQNGAGSWQEITIPDNYSAFDPATLDPVAVAAAAGAGFVVMGVPLVAAWAVRVVVASVRDAGD